MKIKDLSMYYEKVISKIRKEYIWIIYICICFVLSRFLFFLASEYSTIKEFITAQNVYDAGWYSGMATNYLEGNFYFIKEGLGDSGQISLCFFPLYPCIIAILHAITSINNVYVGSIFSSICMMIAEFYAFLYIIETKRNIKIAYIYTFLLSFGAYTFYFSTLYTESLFLLLFTMSMYYMVKGDFIKMGICGAFSSLTRNVGIMFVFVVLVYCIQKYCQNSSYNKKSIKDFVVKSVSNYKLVFGTMLIPIGLFSYIFAQYLIIGDGMAFVHGQVGWWRENVGILTNFKNDFFSTFPSGYLSSVFLIIVFLIVVNIKSDRYYESVFPFVVIALSATSSLGSVPRYMMGAFTILLSLSELISTRSRLYQLMVVLCTILIGMAMELAWMERNGLLL